MEGELFMKQDLSRARILIVDDEETNVELLQDLLQTEGYTNYLGTTDPRQALTMYSSLDPDLILLDLMMPYLDGYVVLQQIRSRVPDGAYVPIIVLTADSTPEAKKRALSMGAKDFLTKPLDGAEVALRIKNLLETRFLHLRVVSHAKVLEEEIRERTQEIRQAHMETLKRLALAAEYRDDNTGEHAKRVGDLSALLARAIGLSEAQVELIRHAATLHDLGKIAIPERLFVKAEKLTAAEQEVVKTHVAIGAKILSGTDVPLFQMAEEIALYHHERWDGAGYAQLEGESIPITARIVAVADTFDVLTHDRPYRQAWVAEKAADEIERQSGRQFDPTVVEAFLTWRRREEMPRRIREALLS
jgi:putative two-component system response regulator